MPSPTQPAAEFISIREVAGRTGLPPSTIRYYDQQFGDFLDIQRGSGRRRLFSLGAVQRLLEIQRLLRDEGLSLRQVRQVLEGRAPGNAVAGTSGEMADLKAQVAGLAQEVAALKGKVRDLKEIQQRTLALVDSLTRT